MLTLQVARAFKHFDRDNSGTITDDEVAVVLKVRRSGQPFMQFLCERPSSSLRPLMLLCCSSRAQDQGLSPEDISALIAEHDSNKDGVIDYQEFLAMMRWVVAARRHTTHAGIVHLECHVRGWSSHFNAGWSWPCRNQGPLAQQLENCGSGRLAKSRAVSRRAKAKSLLSNMFKSK